MAIVGSAKVRISPDTTGFAGSLRAALERSRASAAAAGRSAGEAFAAEFNRAVDNATRDSTRRLERAWSGAGRGIGRSAGQGIEQEIDASLNNVERSASRRGDRIGDNLASAATSRIQRGIGRGVSGAFDGMERDAGRSGDRVGFSFSQRLDKALNSGVGQAARAASKSFTMFFAQAQLGAVAISGLVGALSSLVSGLYLVGTAAVSAGSSLVALGGMLGAAVQGGVALGIAFKGVGKAIGAGFKEQTAAAAGAGQAGVAAARRVADARARINETQIKNARRLADAERRIDDARRKLAATTLASEERVANAKNRVIDAENKYASAVAKSQAAQAKLNDAYRAGAEYLQQLGFDAEDAVLAQERAALELERATARLQQARDVAPPGSRALQEIELAYKEAELAMRKANDRVNDTKELQDKASEAGIEGTKAVVDAQNDILEAAKDVAEAEYDLAKAQADAAKAQVDAENDIADAKRNVADAERDKKEAAADAARDMQKANQDLTRALEDQKNASTSATKAANAYADAMKNLSPSAQEFVRYLVSMKERFNEFKKAVQEPFFAAFNAPFKEMVETLLPIAQTRLAATSAILGQLAGQFAGALTANADNFAKALEFNNELLIKFGETTATGKSAIGNLVDIFFRLLEAIKPVTERFADWLVKLTEMGALATDSAKEMEAFTEFFNRAGDRMAKFGEIFGHIIDLFGTLAKAAGPAIDTLLQYFSDSFAGMASTAEKNVGAIANYFNGVVNNVMPLLDLLGQLGLLFLEMGAAPQLGEAFEILKGGIDPLRTIIKEGNNVLPTLARIIVSILGVMESLSNTGAIEEFFGVFEKVAAALDTLFKNNVVQSILQVLGPIMGITSALSLLGTGAGKVAQIFSGRFLNAVNPISKLATGISHARDATAAFGGGIRGAAGALRVFLGPVGIIITVLSVLIPLFIKMYKENEQFREAIDRLVKTVMDLVGTLVDALAPIIETVAALFADLMAAIAPLIADLATALVPLIETLADIISGTLVPIIKDLLPIVSTIIQSVVKVFKAVLVPALEVVISVVKIVASMFSDLLTAAFGIVKRVWDSVGKPLFDIMSKVIKAVATVVEDVAKILGTVFKTWWDAVDWAWKTFGKPVFDTVVKVIEGIVGVIGGIVSGVSREFTNVYNALKSIYDKHIAPFVETVTDAFASIPQALADAWDGAKAGLKSGINGVIGFINGALDAIEVVTKPFGITFGTIPKLATGGYVTGPGGPTSDKVPAWLSNGEYVVKASTVSAVGGKRAMDAFNAGNFPIGGFDPLDWAKDGFRAITGAASKIAEEGLNKIVKPLWNGSVGAYGEKLTKDGTFVGGLVGGIIKKFGEVFFGKLDEANKKQEDAKREAAAASAGGAVPAYSGKPGGWTYPLGRRFPGKNWAGHNPPNAIDISSPVGIPVIAASAGVVYVLADLGSRSYGKHIKISHAGGMRTVYAHLSRFATKRGATVATGDLIGYSGNSGGSSGPHLHFELNPSSSTIAAMRARGVALASGGTVKATPGGVMALLAEAGKHERVEPLDSKGLSARDYALIDAMAKKWGAQGGGPTIVRVYIGEKELVDMIKYEVTDSQANLARDLRSGRRRY